MLTGTYDPTTPTRWADEAAATLTRAQVARFPGVGHVVINTGACPFDSAEQYATRRQVQGVPTGESDPVMRIQATPRAIQ